MTKQSRYNFILLLKKLVMQEIPYETNHFPVSPFRSLLRRRPHQQSVDLVISTEDCGFFVTLGTFLLT